MQAPTSKPPASSSTTTSSGQPKHPHKKPALTGANSMTVWHQYRFNRTDYTIAKDELNFFGCFKNASLYQEYLMYHLNTKPFSACVFFLSMIALIFLPGSVIAFGFYASIGAPDPSFLAVSVLLVFSQIMMTVLGALYLTERFYPKWKIYKKCWQCLKRFRRRYAVIYTTESLTSKSNGTSRRSLASTTSSDRNDLSDGREDEEDHEEKDDEDEDLSVSLYYSGSNAYNQDPNKGNINNLYGSMSKKIVILQQFFLINLMLFNILFYIRNSIQENCHDYGNSILNSLLRNCDHELLSGNVDTNHIGHKIDAYPLLFMFTPILLACIFREALFELQIINHFVVIIIALVITIVYSWNSVTIGILCMWSIGGYCILIDLHLHNVAAFLTSYQLREILLEKERNADRAAAAEMRHMIGNVAHDLKTPLSSFTTGLEIIADIIETNEKTINILQGDENTGFGTSSSNPALHLLAAGNKEYTNLLHSHSNNSSPGGQPFNSSSKNVNSTALSTKSSIRGLLENNYGIKHCLQNIRDTNTFMLMTINRCIDYTKASRGFKLIPKHETLDLMETLRLPLDCMKNIQERINIVLKPIETKEICSHIITDKQWLQENILCLLSNAVKYSNGGEVTIAVYLTKIEKANLKAIALMENEQKKAAAAAAAAASASSSRSTVKSKTRSSLTEKFRNQISQTFFSIKQLNPTRSSASEVLNNGLNDDTPPPPLSQTNSLSSIQDLPILKNTISIISRQKSHSQLPDIEEGKEKATTRDSDGSDVQRAGSIAVSRTAPITENRSAQGSSNNNNTPTHFIRFDIEDTGIGMSAEAMTQLFSPFRQAQRLAGGTGLGLYSLAKRVEALNGSYGVMKRPDGKQGSLFWFSIPYKPDYTTAELFSSLISGTSSFRGPGSVGVGGGEDGKSDHHSFSNNMMMSPPPSHGQLQLRRRNSLDLCPNDIIKLPPLQILLVDDSPSIIKMSSMMLKRQGHIIQTADNGENALKRIQQQWLDHQKGFDIILMDLQMPVMDGLEATRRLRRHEKSSPDWIQPPPPPPPTSSSSVDKIDGDDPTLESVGGSSSRKSPSPMPYFLLQEYKITHLFQTWCEHSSNRPYHHAVIGVSANSDDETAHDAVEAGVDAFLPKPFSMDLFNSTVIKVLTKIYDNYEQ